MCVTVRMVQPFRDPSLYVSRMIPVTLHLHRVRDTVEMADLADNCMLFNREISLEESSHL